MAHHHLLYPTNDHALADHCRNATRRALQAPNAPHIPVSNPVTLDATNVSILLNAPYVVAHKADGVRYLLVLTQHQNRNVAAMVDRAGAVFTLLVQAPVELFRKGCVFDGELCNCMTDQTAFDYYVFDTLSVRGESIVHYPYRNRLLAAMSLFPQRPLMRQERRGMTVSFIQPVSPALTFMMKETAEASNLRGFVRRANIRYRTDGFVFTATQLPLHRGRDEHLFKWKEHHPIDVRLVITHGNLDSARMYLVDQSGADVNIGDALRGLFRNVYLNTQTSPELGGIIAGAAVYNRIFHTTCPVNFDKVVEMSCEIVAVPETDDSELRLTFCRLRPDKDSANDITTVIRTIHTIRNSLSFTELCEMLEQRSLAGQAHAAHPADPANPAHPAHPVNPADPAHPAHPVNPANPAYHAHGAPGTQQLEHARPQQSDPSPPQQADPSPPQQSRHDVAKQHAAPEPSVPVTELPSRRTLRTRRT
jgi:hypothetical protein